MPNFSFFWRKHYNEIGNCCMTYPLEGHIYIDPAHAKAAEKFGQKQLVKDFIDTSWMSQKGLKWIGWDIQGWLAWTDPNGMLYRIKDLKRNEDGVAFEKDVNEVKSELEPRVHQGNPSAEALYRYERDVQKECGFCPGDRRGSVDPEVDKKPGIDATPEEEEKDLDDLMKGKYSPYEPQGDYNPITNDEEVTASEFVVDVVPVLPPAPMPAQPPAPGATDTLPVTVPPLGAAVTEEDKLVKDLIERAKKEVKNVAGPDDTVIIRVVIEGKKKPDGSSDNKVTEEVVQQGKPGGKTQIYQIWVQGLTENGGITSGGGIRGRWLGEDEVRTIQDEKNAQPTPTSPPQPLPTPQKPWQPPKVELTPYKPKLPPDPPKPTPPPRTSSDPGAPPTKTPPPRENVESGTALTSPRMSQDMAEYIDQMANDWEGTDISQIEVTANVGNNIMDNWYVVDRGGMPRVDSKTGRPAGGNEKGSTKLIPNTNTNTNLNNVNAAINDLVAYMKSVFKGVSIILKINYGTPNSGVTFTFTPRRR